MNFAHPHFAAPQWLPLTLLAGGALFWLQRYAAAARRRQLQQLAAPHRLAELTRAHSPARQRLKEIFLLAAVALLGLALARPQWGELQFHSGPVTEDLVFVVDCSRSMLAADVQPNRLARAKLSILNFVRTQGRGRVGLVAFAGGAFLQCPLTFDYGAFAEALQNLDTRAIPVGGTDIGVALEEAYRGMDRKSTRKTIVLITDGEDLENNGVKEATALAKEGVVVHALGVGTPAGAELFTREPDGRLAVVRTPQGAVVRSRLDEKTLRAIATATGGEYQPLGRIGEGLQRVSHVIHTGRSAAAAPAAANGVDRYYVPLALGLLLLVLESLLHTRRNRSTAPSVALLLLLSLTLTPTARAADAPPTARLDARQLFNAGTKKYSAGKLDEAERLLQEALDRQQDSLQPRALYNLGSVRFDQGTAELKKAPDGRKIQAAATQALNSAAGALTEAQAALATDDVARLTAAYQRGRGARREIGAAFKAVRQALELYGHTLEKWRLALTDFRGSAELQLPGPDAAHNAEVVERAIAKLIDQERQRQMEAMQMANLGAKLQELMQQLKGKLPDGKVPGEAPGDEDGESDDPNVVMLRQNQPQESRGTTGSEQELSLSPAEAGRLLNNLAPTGKQLPMGRESATPRKNPPPGRDW